MSKVLYAQSYPQKMWRVLVPQWQVVFVYRILTEKVVEPSSEMLPLLGDLRPPLKGEGSAQSTRYRLGVTQEVAGGFPLTGIPWAISSRSMGMNHGGFKERTPIYQGL